jgi:hypothetical protein
MNSAKKTGPVNFVHGLLFIVNTSMIRERLQNEKGNYRVQKVGNGFGRI